MNHAGTKTIETPRLILRAFMPDDVDAMRRNWVTDAEVPRYLTWQPHADPALTQALAERWARQAAEDPKFYQWAVVPKELGEPIGSLSVVRMDERTETAELGWCIGRNWWGRAICQRPPAPCSSISCGRSASTASAPSTTPGTPSPAG